MRDPSTIPDMTELRAEIDRTDRQLIELMAHRARLIDRAIALKPALGWPARIDARVEEVVENARNAAFAQSLDPDLVEEIWRRMVEWSIAREEIVLGKGERG
ncbi:chorismate mutase [Paenirhodobacter sp.]|jgi:isochorismate pyruvate lyase|uniref:chorismate mutase n=1 Tax=Paenirhodobacter sp. TaxID=1965326 RepID=UPI003B507D36